MIISVGFSLFEFMFRSNGVYIRVRCWNKKGGILIGVLYERGSYVVYYARLFKLEISYDG